MKPWYVNGQQMIEGMRQLTLPDTCAAIWPIGQVGLFLQYQGKTLLIDPVLVPIKDAAGESCLNFEAPFAPEADFPVDIVLCTHNHEDHLNPETLQRLAAAHPDARFYIPQGVAAETRAVFAAFADRVEGIRQGQTLSLWDQEAVSVTGIGVPHDHYMVDEDGNEKAMGYFLRLGPITIFHAGDTTATDRLVQEVTSCGPLTAAFLPINGRDWVRESHDIIGNMTPQEAAILTRLLEPKVVIPTHYDLWKGNTESPMIFAHYMMQEDPAQAFHFLKPGEPYILYAC